jgi:hypothetical protein
VPAQFHREVKQIAAVSFDPRIRTSCGRPT